MEPELELVLGQGDVARELNVNRTTVWRMHRRGELVASFRNKRGQLLWTYGQLLKFEPRRRRARAKSNSVVLADEVAR